MKHRKKRKLNQGNSFIVVVATISFLAVLVTALLVAVALCYRMKSFDLNSRNNFYYLEQAMDEIYEGVGQISMKNLTAAYNETAQGLVYYDMDQESYATMDNAHANEIMKSTYVVKMQKETNGGALDAGTITEKITSLITNGTLGSGGNIIIDVDSVQWADDVLTIKDIVLKREATYGTTRNYNKQNGQADADYVQSIRTDLVISYPDFKVNFETVDNNEMYNYVMISDMGVEVNGIGTNSHITGNIYAASDFYNKKYNEDADTRVNYHWADNSLDDYDGITEKSMYSGFYIDGAKVSIITDKMIVPGSIAAMNCAELSIVGLADGGQMDYANVWADGIVLGGYSRKLTDTTFRGSKVDMKADTYIYDDLEVNSTGAEFALDGTYYGYNYASTDNRTYNADFIAAASNRKYLDNLKINDGNYIGDNGSGGHLTGQAHYNSSAVVVNGEDATLNLANVSSMYIAGQAYVEMSKATTSTTYAAAETGGKLSLTAIAEGDTSDGEKVTQDTYTYAGMVTDAAGEVTDNYTTNNANKNDATTVQDYRTGEALSIKSNQLAYIPPYAVTEDITTGKMYVKWPAALEDEEFFRDMWDELDEVPVIKTVVGGSTYYFYDFSKANAKYTEYDDKGNIVRDNAGNPVTHDITMNMYLEMYNKLFTADPGQERSTGDLVDFYNIEDYEAFEVKDVTLDTTGSQVYTNSAISVKNGDKVTIVADSKNVDALVKANNALDAGLQANNGASTDANYSTNISKDLQKQYKEMKMLLSNVNVDGADVQTAYDAAESEITPLNYYFNLNSIGDKESTTTLLSEYKVIIDKNDVKITEDIKGIVICKGDVTFDNNVKEFEGLIVAGGKIIVEHSMNFVANAEIVKSILKECDDNYPEICNLFKKYVQKDKIETNNDIQTVKSMDSIVYEDIMAFENWKKNVD